MNVLLAVVLSLVYPFLHPMWKLRHLHNRSRSLCLLAELLLLLYWNLFWLLSLLEVAYLFAIHIHTIWKKNMTNLYMSLELNDGTTDKCLSVMLKMGGVDGMLLLH